MSKGGEWIRGLLVGFTYMMFKSLMMFISFMMLPLYFAKWWLYTMCVLIHLLLKELNYEEILYKEIAMSQPLCISTGFLVWCCILTCVLGDG